MTRQNFTGAFRMRRWAWGERARCIRLISAAGWCVYVLIALMVIRISMPLAVWSYPLVVLLVLVAFIGPPAWIHFNWVFAPAYLFGSHGIRRIRFSGQVLSQVSLNNNVRNPFGVPELPSELHTTPSTIVVGDDESIDSNFAEVRARWDDYLYASGRTLFPTRRLPKSTMRGILEFGSDRLVVSAGGWRPGVVLALPYSKIVGVWNGSQIKTIDSGGALVVVVDSGEDTLLFPLEVVRVEPKTSPRAAVDRLARLLESRRQQWVGARGASGR